MKPASPKIRPLKGGRLEPYRAKRDLEVTPEPTESRATPEGNSFVIQNHAATRLHWDFRLEMGGVHRSWAVTKVPTLDPSVKRLAVHTEDHPTSYGDFEGTIPAGQYGAGTVIIWDRGTWAPMGDIEADYHKGSFKFRLAGTKLKGGFALVRLRDKAPKDHGKNWLLIKEKDEYARPGSGDALAEQNKSVVSGLTLAEMKAHGAVAHRDQAPRKKPKKVKPADLPKSKAAPLGDVPEPQLASLASHPPHGSGWVHEIKYDGYRTLARIEGGVAKGARSLRDVQMITRNGHDWTDRYKPVAKALAHLPVKNAIVDGEICVQLPNGATSFAALQDALASGAAIAAANLRELDTGLRKIWQFGANVIIG
jgi:bifunctional non-homologous end joining protein LigD